MFFRLKSKKAKVKNSIYIFFFFYEKNVSVYPCFNLIQAVQIQNWIHILILLHVFIDSFITFILLMFSFIYFYHTSAHFKRYVHCTLMYVMYIFIHIYRSFFNSTIHFYYIHLFSLPNGINFFYPYIHLYLFIYSNILPFILHTFILPSFFIHSVIPFTFILHLFILLIFFHLFLLPFIYSSIIHF